MKSLLVLSVVGATLLLAGGAQAAEKASKAEAKKTFLVTTTHTPEQCLAALDEMAAKNKKLLSKVEWGCKSGDHTGYIFLEAADEKAAVAQLPETNRVNAKAVMVTKFTPEELREIHKMMEQKK